jgi:histidyl-tRNA synthetase
MIKRVRGTEDILDLTLSNFVLNAASKYFEQHNFVQIQTPILEPTELFVHSIGQDTDVVSKEMYIFPDDGICLRPEVTASTIRACFENRIDSFPWKTFSYGPMFRKERPQKGRWRQFSQFNMEIIGTESIAQDVYFIKMLDQLFSEKLLLENYVVKINFLGCIKDRKEHRQKLVGFLDGVGDKICKTCCERKEKNVLRIFDCKNEHCQSTYQDAPKLTECLCLVCQGDWDLLRELLQLLSVSYIEEPKLVRGLDYYNKTVFEFTSMELGAQDAFCGGGRYSLGHQVGAKKDYDSVGAAIGVGRLLMLVQKTKDRLAIPQKSELTVVLPVTKEQDILGLLFLSQIDLLGVACDIVLEKASMTNMMKKANKMGAKFVVIIGQEEQDTETVVIKNMQTGENVRMKQIEAVESLKSCKS